MKSPYIKALLSLLILMCITFSSCAYINREDTINDELKKNIRTDMLNNLDMKKLNDELIVEIYEAIYDTDHERMKLLFSEAVIENTEQLDDKIEMLIGLFSEAEWVISDEGTGSENKTSNDDTLYWSRRDSYILSNGELDYYISIAQVIENSEDPKQVGLREVYVVLLEDKMEFFETTLRSLENESIYIYNYEKSNPNN